MKILKWLGIAVVGLIVIGFIGAMFSGGDKATTSAPGDNASDFVVKVTGTDGTAFSGSYMIVTADGKSVSKSVDGTIPTEYPVDGMMVSTSFQKQGESGRLKVEIIKGDQVVAESETEAAYGMVTAASK